MDEESWLLVGGLLAGALLIGSCTYDCGGERAFHDGVILSKSYAPSAYKTEEKWVVLVKVDGHTEPFTVERGRWDALTEGERVRVYFKHGRWSEFEWERGVQ